jgi:hypothetical protein
MSIQNTQLLGPYTNVIADVYKQMPEATNFLTSYFPSKIELTRFISYFVMRDDEQVAVDVARGSEGNRNEWSIATEKIGDPLYFRENFDILPMQGYDALLNPSLALAPAGALALSSLVRTVAEKQAALIKKIKRAIEIMCAQILMTGVIEMSANGTGISIDYKRKAASLQDTSVSAPWTTGATDVYEQIETDCTFLRAYGKTTDMEFDLIAGNAAFNALLKNTTFLERQKSYNMKLDSVNPPARVSVTSGAVWNGRLSAGPYTVNIYTYPQSYDVLSVVGGNIVRTPTQYIDTNKYVIIPKTPYFKTFFGAVPPIVDGSGNATPIAGDFVFTDWVAADKRSHNYDIESCPLPVPVAIDQIVTRKVRV